MQFWQAIILGLVQGATEFLPISSSGHLIFFRQVLGIQGEYLIFDVMMHLATLGAVFVCLKKDIIQLFTYPFKKLGVVILSAIPACIVGFVGKDIDGVFGGGILLSVCFLVSAIIAFVSHGLAKKSQTEIVSGKTVTCMAIAQCVAILPGVSRSGSTMLGGLIAKTDAKTVAPFSFLMSVPIIAGSALLETLSVITDGSMGVGLDCIIVGMAFAFVSGLIAVKTVMKLVKKSNFFWFGIYLLAISIINLALCV